MLFVTTNQYACDLNQFHVQNLRPLTKSQPTSTGLKNPSSRVNGLEKVAECVFARVGDVEESLKVKRGQVRTGKLVSAEWPLSVHDPLPLQKTHIIILVLLVNQAHKSIGRRQHVRDKDENRLFRAQLDALPDDIDKLAHSQVGRHEVLLLVDGGDVGFLGTFDDAE